MNTTPRQLELTSDVEAKFLEVASVGRDLVDAVHDRAMSNYSIPMLDPIYWPDAMALKKPIARLVTEDDVEAARKASLDVAVEACFQISKSKQRPDKPRAVIEGLGSLQRLQAALADGIAFIGNVRAADEATFVTSVRESLARHYVPDLDALSNDQIIALSGLAMSEAVAILAKRVAIIESYIAS